MSLFILQYSDNLTNILLISNNQEFVQNVSTFQGDPSPGGGNLFNFFLMQIKYETVRALIDKLLLIIGLTSENKKSSLSHLFPNIKISKVEV